MQKILVTGGLGFIGSNLIKTLIKKNFYVINIDKISYSSNFYNTKEFSNNKNYKFIKCDLRNKIKLIKILFQFKPKCIFNLAAETHVDRSIDAPTNFINSNIFGTFVLLEAFKKYFNNFKKKKLIHISTDEVYGDVLQGRSKETDAYKPSSPYSASKAASDHLVRAWNKTFGLPTLITNCSNNYGPYQFPEKLIPLIIINCINQKQLPVYGEGQNIRDWLYVDDHCEAIKKVLEKGKIGETYNIGGNNEIKNIDIVKQICGIMDELIPRSKGNRYSELIKFVKDRPGHDFRYAIDSSKIKENLNWTPNETFKTGIRKTIMWYIDNKIWWKKIQDGTYSQERLGELKK